MPPPEVRYARPKLPLRTPRLLLRPFRASDAPSLAAALRIREVTRTIPLWPSYTRIDAQEFIARAQRKLRSGAGYNLAILWAETGGLVGGIGLEPRLEAARGGHIGYWVVRDRWGQGIATEAAHKVCSEGFRTLHLHRLDTSVARGNERSRAVLLRLGFRSEGFDRERFLIDGKYCDAERFGLLAGELRRVPPSVKP